MDYRDKYLKYKNKYTQLQKLLGGTRPITNAVSNTIPIDKAANEELVSTIEKINARFKIIEDNNSTTKCKETQYYATQIYNAVKKQYSITCVSEKFESAKLSAVLLLLLLLLHNSHISSNITYGIFLHTLI